MSHLLGDDKISLLDALDRAERDGTLLQLLEEIHKDNLEAKWQWAGMNHSIWARNMKIAQNRHIKPKNNRIPWPIENHGWALMESVRPTWGDNPPQFNIAPLRPGLEEKTPKLRTLWRWIEWRAGLHDFWEGLYDYGSPIGTVAGKALFDPTAPGGGAPLLGVLDPRSIACDPFARQNHRHARILETTHLVEVGELAALYPEIKGKITAKDSEVEFSSGDRAITRSADFGDEGRSMPGARSEDRMAEVVEMWVRADIMPIKEDALRQSEALEEAEPTADDTTYFVYTFIPGAGVIKKETVTTGLQLGTAQFWRNPEALYGWSDFDFIAGLVIATNQLHIRAHAHRLAVVAPPLILPRTSGLTRRQVSGRPAPIWEVTGGAEDQRPFFMDVPGPSRDVIEFIATQPQVMRRLLGVDELTPDFFNREQTAAATAMVLAALENRTRQKIRNMRAMVEDLAKALLRLSIEHLPAGVAVPDEADPDRFVELSLDELNDINVNDFAIVSNLGKPGALSRQAQSAAIDRVYGSGVLDPNNPQPLVMKEVFIEASDIPRKDEIIKALREQEAMKQQALMSQQVPSGADIPPTPSGGPGLPGGGSTPLPTQSALGGSVSPELSPAPSAPAAVEAVTSISNFRGGLS